MSTSESEITFSEMRNIVVSIPGRASSGSFINLNSVNLSSSTLQVVNTPIVGQVQQQQYHVNRPTLLRRSRTTGSVNNPLLGHSIREENSSSAPAVNRIGPQAYTACSLNSTGSATTIMNTNPSSSSSQNTAASDLPPVSSFLKKIILPPTAPQMEEIIILQPDSEECQVVEVEQADLVRYLEEEQDGGGGHSKDIQQIIVCDNDNYQYSNFFQNYVVDVIFPTPEISMTVFGNNSLSSSPVTRKKSHSKKVISLIPGDGNFTVRDDPVLVKTKKSKHLIDLRCLEPECETIVHNVHDLRTHLHQDHGMSFHEEFIHFDSEQEFQSWRTQYEGDQKVSFIYRGGTKKISTDKAVTYLICHRSGVYKPTMTHIGDRKRKMKPQGSCKIGTHCTAGIKLVKHLTTKVVEATICHTHYGHDLNTVQHLRVTGVIKELVLRKFSEGLTFPEVLQYVHHNPENVEALRLVDRRAIRNIYDQWRKQNEKNSTKKKDLENVDKGDYNDLGININPVQDINATATSNENAVVNFKGVSTSSKESDVLFKNYISDEGKRPPSPRVSRKRKLKNLDCPTSFTDSSSIAQQQPAEPQCVDSIVTKLLEHGESGSSGPTILMYKKEGELRPRIGGGVSRLHTVSDMCLVIQTPIQRQLLEQFSRVVHLELVQGADLDILAVVVLDEFLMGIPVAWMISNSISDRLIENFFHILRINCHQISCDYLFATKKSLLHYAWYKVFTWKPRVLYPQEDVIREIKIFLRKHYDEVVSRGKLYEIIEKMILTPDKAKFEEGLKVLEQSAKNSNFLEGFKNQWYDCRSRWAFHTRTQIHPAVEDSFLKLRKFILFKGTKSLDRNIEDILKIGYDKCFQHDKSLYKGDIKVHAILDELHNKHSQSSESCWTIERLDERKYIVNDCFEVYDLKSICNCKIQCVACEICVHQLMCSCGDSQFCVHIHAVKSYMDRIPFKRNDVTSTVAEFKGSMDFLEVQWMDDQPENINQINTHSDVEVTGLAFVATSNKLRKTEKIPTTSSETGSEETVPRVTMSKKSDVLTSEHDDETPKTPTITPIIFESAEPISSFRQISTRLQYKNNKEPQVQSKIQKRGEKANPTDSLDQVKRNPSSSSTLQTLEEEKVSLAKQGKEKSKQERETVREELLSLINQIDSIQDKELFDEVKRKVSDLSNVVKRSE